MTKQYIQKTIVSKLIELMDAGSATILKFSRKLDYAADYAVDFMAT